LLESERHKKVLAEGGEDDFAATWGFSLTLWETRE
jgi:hypothetical protein